MKPDRPLEVASQSLEQLKAYGPKSDHGRAMKATNLRQLHHYIAALKASQVKGS